jgi:hypothetical protein
LAGQYFDIRLEVHQPVNGSEAIGKPLDERFTFTVAKKGAAGAAKSAVEYFKIEKWNFTWFEDLFARDAKKPSLVNVASKAYRRVALYEPGEYTATLSYNNGSKTTATWLVRDLAEERKAKNIILFVRNVHVRTACEIHTDFVHAYLDRRRHDNKHDNSGPFDRP